MITRSQSRRGEDRSVPETNRLGIPTQLNQGIALLEPELCGGRSDAPRKDVDHASLETAQVCFTPQRILRVHAWVSPEKTVTESEWTRGRRTDDSSAVESVPLTARTVRELRRLGVPVPSTILDRTALGTPHIRGMARRRLDLEATFTPNNASSASESHTDVTIAERSAAASCKGSPPESSMSVQYVSAGAESKGGLGQVQGSDQTSVCTTATDCTAQATVCQQPFSNSSALHPVRIEGAHQCRALSFELDEVADVSLPSEPVRSSKPSNGSDSEPCGSVERIHAPSSGFDDKRLERSAPGTSIKISSSNDPSSHCGAMIRSDLGRNRSPTAVHGVLPMDLHGKYEKAFAQQTVKKRQACQSTLRRRHQSAVIMASNLAKAQRTNRSSHRLVTVALKLSIGTGIASGMAMRVRWRKSLGRQHRYHSRWLAIR
ncbi:hypothetical protein CCYA_CCYA14G3738 [Cyanidiococcus yangmingshanensis]|nr:hypothetical protein CCYA_CCYA14G3738 [Cyanidiococcus yangmingshanensis]